MTPLIATLFALAANLVAAAVAARAPEREARAPVVAGALVTLGAAAFSAFPLLVGGEVVEARLMGLPLRADALTATLLLPLGLAVLALALGMPQARSRTLSSLALALAGTELALVADALPLLVLGEALSAVAVARALHGPGTRVARLTLAASGLAAAVALVLAGGASLSAGPPLPASAALALGLAVALRLGLAPAQSGLTATLGGQPKGAGLLLALPLGGGAALVRAVQPGLAAVDPHANLALVALVLAALAAALAVRALDLGRSAAWTLSALHGLLVVGNLSADASGRLGGELLWAALLLSEAGWLLALAMVTRRLGPVDLRRMHGLGAAAPKLGLAFLLLAVTLAGLPGSLEFVAEDVLLNGLSHGGVLGLGLAVIVLAAVGYNALRLTVQVFYGPGCASRPDMDLKPLEVLVMLSLVALVLFGGLAPGLLPLVAGAGGGEVAVNF